MWALFELLVEKGYTQVKQRRAFIRLIQFVNLHAGTPFLTDEDKSTLQTLNNMNSSTSDIPHFDSEKADAEKKLVTTLTILQQNLRKLNAVFLGEIAQEIDNNARTNEAIDQLWKKIAREFSCLVDTNAIEAQQDEYQAPSPPNFFVRAVGVAALATAGVLLFRKLASDFANSNCSIPESINNAIDARRSMFD